MKRITHTSILPLCFLSAFIAVSILTPFERVEAISNSWHSSLEEISGDEYWSTIRSEGKVLIIFFTGKYCAPCRKLDANLTTLQRRMPNLVRVVRVEVHRNPQLNKARGVKAIPLIEVYKNGRLQKSIQGNRSADSLAKMVDRYSS